MSMEDIFQPYDKRLDRIEEKLDKLADAVASIARVEEKIYASTKRIDRHEFRMDTIETEVLALRASMAGANKSLSSMERFVWICVSALATASVYFIKQ
jgi:tRNA(Ser,Leu) C12 N-acetylase TAN1